MFSNVAVLTFSFLSWSAVTAVYPAATMATYNPSRQVEWLHQRSRFTISGGGATSEFPNNIGSSDSLRWAEGCMAWGGVFALIGLVTSLFILLGYLFALCCSCKPCSSKKKDETNRKTLSNSINQKNSEAWAYNRKLYLITLGSVFIFLVLTFTTFYPVTSFFDDGINRALDGIESAQRTLQRLINVATSLIGTLTTLEKTTRDAANVAENEDSGNAAGLLMQFSGDVNDTKDIAQQGISAARDLYESLDDVVSDGRDASDEYAKKIAFSYVAILCVSTVIFLITLIPKKLCSLPYKVIGVPLNTVFLLLLWTFTGVYLVVGMMSADFCIKPNQNTIELFEASVGPNSASTQSVRYYLSCDPTSPEGNITQSDGVRYDVRETVTETQRLETAYEKTIEDVKDEIENDNAQRAVLTVFREVNSTLQGALDTVLELDDIASCSSIRRTWDIFIDALCEHFISDGVITLFGLQTCMSVMLIFIMIFGWSFCIRHPSRTFQPEEKQRLIPEDVQVSVPSVNRSRKALEWHTVLICRRIGTITL
eukprot:gb/GECG01006829.1/.p1 GENE.gb/GECG01006829.1/~~gb/GECG01006829.1/.p1  ORF type:complete len:539 (+),score=43.15 gb/GECG01006829.1/:1-1617(+)